VNGTEAVVLSHITRIVPPALVTSANTHVS
jgi:hypothetical protein